MRQEGQTSLNLCGAFVNTEGEQPSSGPVSGVSIWYPEGKVRSQTYAAGHHDSSLNLRRDLGSRGFRGRSGSHSGEEKSCSLAQRKGWSPSVLSNAKAGAPRSCPTQRLEPSDLIPS